MYGWNAIVKAFDSPGDVYLYDGAHFRFGPASEVWERRAIGSPLWTPHVPTYDEFASDQWSKVD